MPPSDSTNPGDTRQAEPSQREPADTEPEEAKHGAIGHLSADEEMQQAVCEALIEDTALDSSDIRVRATHETVVLSGSVPTRSEWQRAMQIARAQAGVARVQVDDLSIRNA